MRKLSFLASLALMSACGGADTKVQPPQPVATSPSDLHAVCVQTFERQRDCTDTFLPALVALRVKLDVPPGIASADATDGRDALIAKAKAEWQVDSTPTAIGQTCDRITQQTPQEKRDPTSEQAKQCLSATDCEAFTTCIMPVIEEHMVAH